MESQSTERYMKAKYDSSARRYPILEQPNNTAEPFTTIAAVIFTLVAFVYILRVFSGWEVTVSGMAVPMWASVAGLVIAAGLAVMLLREARK